VAHLYNLRKSQRYRERLLNYTKTRPTAVQIGERRKPQPQGQPGFLRLDTVHQGDQSEVERRVSITSTLSIRLRSGRWWAQRRASRRPIWSRFWSTCCISFLFASLVFIPTTARNLSTAWLPGLLDKTGASNRPRAGLGKSGDNGLVETKNGAIIRKHIGYGYIDAGHADTINSFYREYLNPYLNYHRPCAQADVEIDRKGRKRIRYKRYQTRWRPCRCCRNRHSTCAMD